MSKKNVIALSEIDTNLQNEVLSTLSGDELCNWNKLTVEQHTVLKSNAMIKTKSVKDMLFLFDNEKNEYHDELAKEILRFTGNTNKKKRISKRIADTQKI